jgi:sugar lactone lactonase YvrE
MTSSWQAIVHPRCELGEGLFWDATRQCLWFVDIHGRMLHRLSLGGVEIESSRVPQRVGWVIPSAGGQDLLLGLQGGFGLVLVEDAAVPPRWLARPFSDAALRLNDAKADSTGAVWAGSMNNDDESRPDGCLFRLAPDGTLTVHDTGYCVANGPALSPDERLMLHTDSARRTIYAFDLDVAAGRISNKRAWLRFQEADGYPDGMCFDAEGCVWVAHWGGACISRFAMDGTLLQRVELPTSHITNVCFGGEHLDRLFVTSARVGLSSEQLAREPLAGALFEVLQPCVRGLPGRPFGVPS